MNLQAMMPLCLALIMFTMGLGLRLADFKRLGAEPTAIGAGLCGQLLLLPLLAAGIASALELAPSMAMGLMLIALCPGGITSNLFARLANANIALSVSLTALSSLLTMITVPLIFNLASRHFVGDGTALSLPFGKTVIEIGSLTILPIALGMGAASLLADRAAFVERLCSFVSTALFALVILSLWRAQWGSISHAAGQVGSAALALNVIGLIAGFCLGKLTSSQADKHMTLSLEVGVQNSALAFFIAINLLANIEYAAPATVYSVVMVITALAVIPLGRFLSGRDARATLGSAESSTS